MWDKVEMLECDGDSDNDDDEDMRIAYMRPYEKNVRSSCKKKCQIDAR